MKRLRNFLLEFGFLVGLLSGCSSGAELDGIPGTYVNYAEGEYSVAWDTLVVSRVPEKDFFFQVLRKTGFQRKRSGKLAVKQFETKESSVSYVVNAATGFLQEDRTGKTYLVYPGKLLVGSREYLKLDN